MKLLQVCVAPARPTSINGRKVLTATAKQPLAGPVAVGPLGLQGDEQADLSVHGGPGKAVYAYPSEHLAFWQTVRAQARVAMWEEPVCAAQVGANLLIQGVTEDQLFIGDELRFAGCTLAVSEPRFPCFKFNAAMGFKHAAKLMVDSGFCGSYLAVLRPGTLQAGETFELVPGPRELSIRELFKARARA